MKQFVFALFSLLLFGNITVAAQEGIPVYFDYLSDNYYLVHPSMAGIGEGGKIRATIRKQWFDVEDAPNLQTINAHYRVNEKSGVGAIIFNDANGYHSQTGLKLTYAHHLRFSRDLRNLNQISFGLSAGLMQSNLDESEFNSVIPDPIITGGNISSSYYNMDLGVSYNFMELYAHATVLNVLNSKRNVYYQNRQDQANVTVVDNLRRYLLSVGYVFGKSDWLLEPSVMLQMTDFTKEKTIDMNAKVYKKMDFGTVWGGVSYRRSFDGALYQNNSGGVKEQRLQLVTPIVGVNYNNFLVSYNYSYQMGDIRFDNGGFHQITLGYNFGQVTENKYDCKCPAVNY